MIAIAGKSVEGLSWLKAQRMKRYVHLHQAIVLTLTEYDSEQAESNLRFLGLVIFENKLKPGTAPAIQALRACK